jgi:hypothetical protein
MVADEAILRIYSRVVVREQWFMQLAQSNHSWPNWQDRWCSREPVVLSAAIDEQALTHCSRQ